MAPSPTNIRSGAGFDTEQAMANAKAAAVVAVAAPSSHIEDTFRYRMDSYQTRGLEEGWLDRCRPTEREASPSHFKGDVLS